MIPDVSPRGLGGAKSGSISEKKSSDGSNAPNEFEALMKGPERSERKEDQPGRESEGKRSRERDPVTRTAKQEAQKAKPKVVKKSDERKAKSNDEEKSPSSAHAAHVAQPKPVQQPEKIEEGDVEEATDVSIDEVGGTDTTAALTKAKTEIDKQETIRKTSMTDFLDKMKSEFGIEPEQIMEAYSKMSDSAMASAPENSVKEFLAQLPIPQEKLGAATDLYKQMISTTKESDMSEKLAMMDATLDVLDSKLTEMEADPDFKALGPKDQALAKLGKAADELGAMISSDSGPSAVKAQAALDAMNARLLMMRQGADVNGEDLDLEGLDGLDGAENFSDAMKDDIDADDSGLAPTATAAGAKGADAAESVKPQAQAQQGDSQSGGEGKSGQESSVKASKEPIATEESKKAFEQSAKVDAAATADGQTAAKPLNDLSAAQSNPVSGASSTKAPTFQIGSSSSTAAILDRPVTPQEEADNIKQLLNQTQIAMKKGGGEVEMIMKPEGLGSVKVKVGMVDGQLNIQMLTENNTAKKLLEKGLGELRTSLTASQFKVDHLKVDVGADIKQHMDQSKNQDQSRDQARQFAQDFMGRFGEERRGFRQGLMEQAGPRRSYGSGARRPEMVAAESVRPTDASGSKRLNVVA